MKKNKKSLFVGKKIRAKCASFEDPLDCTILDVINEDFDYVFRCELESKKIIYIFGSDISWIEVVPEPTLKCVQ